MSTPRVKDAIVLVAGRGSRLAPLTDTMPKCLVDIDGTPLVIRLLRQLKAAGVQRAHLVVGYRGEDVEAALDGVAGLPDVRWVHNPNWSQYNNAESVRCGMAAIGAPTSFLLCDGDVYVRDERFLHELADDPRANVLGVELRLVRDLDAEDMKFQLEPVDVPWYSRRVVALGKGLVRQWCHGESIGFQVVGRETFGDLLAALEELTEDERTDLYYEDVFAQLVTGARRDEGQNERPGHEFFTHAVQPDAWIEIDTYADLEAARLRFGSAPLKWAREA